MTVRNGHSTVLGLPPFGSPAVPMALAELMTQSAPALKQTPLHARHLADGARMVPFAGWSMPLAYTGIVDEHLRVRTRAGLFDVSHMGELELAGHDALAAVQHLTCNDASRLEPGQIQYSALTTPEGTFVDDLLVYRLADEHFLLVVNAANIEKDLAWIRDRTADLGDVVVVNASSRYALIALQGPASPAILQPLTAIDLGEVRSYTYAHGEVAGLRVLVSRTGYTGEDGFEIFVPPGMAERLWHALLEAGAAFDLAPCGLGARDTLRLEAAMRLSGQDIDETTTVLEAGLGWIIGWQKEFLGAERLRAQKAQGVSRRLVGFELEEPGIARHGHVACVDGAEAGLVTSGTRTPFLEKAIGLAYLPKAAAVADRRFEIDVRGRRLAARVVRLPFYKRPPAPGGAG